MISVNICGNCKRSVTWFVSKDDAFYQELSYSMTRDMNKPWLCPNCRKFQSMSVDEILDYGCRNP